MYRFPEKSFSPSKPFTCSWPDRMSSSLINRGAKVFDVGVPPREFFVGRFGRLLDEASAVVIEETDWLRPCVGVLDVDKGDGMIADLGRVVGAGEGDIEFREKGLLRREALC
jgi:hypothetical protein